LRNPFEKECYKALCKEFGRNNVAYEPQKFDYTTKHVYVPDFRITDGDGVFFVESKGYLRPDNRRTMLAVRDQHPALDLRLLFQRNQKLGSRSKTRYSDWAEQHGFSYCIGPDNLKDIA
jgi:predicted nuclease of restriction endonuclease-like RecB superfamily